MMILFILDKGVKCYDVKILENLIETLNFADCSLFLV